MPPPVDCWKLKIDASFLADTGDASVGIVAKDHRGLVAISACYRIDRCTGAEEAEAEAIRFGLGELAKRYRGRLIIETDCKSLFTLLQPGTPNMSAIHHSVTDIRELVNLFQSVNISVIRRGCNALAHGLAAHARTYGNTSTLAGVPTQLFHLLMTDCNQQPGSL